MISKFDSPIGIPFSTGSDETMLRSIKKFSDVFGIVSYVQDTWFGSNESLQAQTNENETSKQNYKQKKEKKAKKVRLLTAQEETYIMALISAETQTELAPAIKPIFEQGKEQEIISNLTLFIKNRELEIERICQSNFGGFIRSVDELDTVQKGIATVKESIRNLNEQIQAAGLDLKSKTEDLVNSRIVIQNLNAVIESVTSCLYTLSLIRKVREYIENKRFYPAIKILDQIQQVHLRNVVEYEFGKFLRKKIPLMKESIKRRVVADVSSWLLVIRNSSGEVGRFSMAQSNATIEKKEELNALRTKDVKEYTDAVITRRKRGASIAMVRTIGRSVGNNLANYNHRSTDNSNNDENEGESGDSKSSKKVSKRTNNPTTRDNNASFQTNSCLNSVSDGADITDVSVFEVLNLNFAPLYQCSYIHEVLGEKDEFRKYYKENRKLQANMVMQQPPSGSFMQLATQTIQATWTLANPNPSDFVGSGIAPSSSASSFLKSTGIISTSNQPSNQREVQVTVVGNGNSSNHSHLSSQSASTIAQQITLPMYANYFNSIAGFFIIEATVLQTSNDLISVGDVNSLWDMASNKMRAVLQVEVAYCEDIEALPELKNYLLVFCRTLRKYGFNLNTMNDFVKTSLRDRYLNVMLDRLTSSVNQLIEESDAIIQIQIKTDKDYKELITSNELHTLFRDKNKKNFPFTNTVPQVLKISKTFTQDLAKFCSNLPDLDTVVIHGLEQYLKIVANALQSRDYAKDGSIGRLAMMFINSYWLQQSLPLLEEHLNQMGISSSYGSTGSHASSTSSSGGTGNSVLTSSANATSTSNRLDPTPFSDTSKVLEELLYDLNSKAIDVQFEDFLKTCQPQSGKTTTGPRPYIIAIFTEVNQTFPNLKDLPGGAFESMYKREFNLIADRMMGLLLTDRIRYFDLTYVKCLHEDLLFVEDSARKAPVAGLDDNFAELRQIINLLMQPEQKVFLDPPTRATFYNKITNTKKLAAVLKKFKEAGGFGPFSAAKYKRKAVKAVMAQLM